MNYDLIPLLLTLSGVILIILGLIRWLGDDEDDDW